MKHNPLNSNMEMHTYYANTIIIIIIITCNTINKLFPRYDTTAYLGPLLKIVYCAKWVVFSNSVTVIIISYSVAYIIIQLSIPVVPSFQLWSTVSLAQA